MGARFSKPAQKPSNPPAKNVPNQSKPQSPPSSSRSDPPASTPQSQPQNKPPPQSQPQDKPPPSSTPHQEAPKPPPTPQAKGVKDNTIEAYSLILCGAGESGKTTFTRQMKLNFLGQFSREERLQFVATIRGNLIETMQFILAYLEKQGKKVDEELFEQAESITELSAFDTNFTVDISDQLKALWDDPNVQEAFKHRDETAIPDHMEYFYDKIDDLVDDEYIPTNEDILKARIRTIGSDAVTFDLDGAIIRIYDVGGQKSERQHWTKIMNEVESCIFCVSFADFDKPMFEDPSILRITDSLNLFQQISQNPKFSDGPIFLVCNKIDSFTNKIKNGNRFTEVFPDFTGKSRDPDQCADYLIKLFIEKAGPQTGNRKIIPYKISALNPQEVTDVASKICKFISENYYD